MDEKDPSALYIKPYLKTDLRSQNAAHGIPTLSTLLKKDGRDKIDKIGFWEGWRSY